MTSAKGAFAEVVRGIDEQGCAVALKTVVRTAASLCERAAGAGDECAAEASREVHLLQLVAHANVVRLLGAGDANASLTLEWCETDLAQVLRQRALPLCEAATKALFEDLLRALHACHARSVLHRDVKPTNLLLGRDGRLKLADFGNACAVEPGKTLRVGSTTRWYRAPEQLYGASEYGCRVDIWSAGCVLAELLGGAPLLPGESDVHQLGLIHELLGPPDADELQCLHVLPDFGKVALGCARRVPLADALPDAPTAALRLVARLLRYAADARASASDALRDDWLMQLPPPLPRRDVRALVLAMCE